MITQGGKRSTSHHNLKRDSHPTTTGHSTRDENRDKTAESFMANHDAHKRSRVKRDGVWNELSSKEDYGVGFLKEKLPNRFHSNETNAVSNRRQSRGEMMGLLGNHLKK